MITRRVINRCITTAALLIHADTFRAGPEIDAGQLDQVREAATRLIESQQNQLDNQFVNLAFVPDSK